MAAGIAQLELIRELAPHEELERRTRRLVEGLLANATDLGVAATGGSLGSMWGVFFAAAPVHDFADAQRSDVALFRQYFHHCLNRGVFFAPSAFEAGFVSTEHQDVDIEFTIGIAREALRASLP
jgi:glutamate-1-semialdehyde 2,1-aminomutase